MRKYITKNFPDKPPPLPFLQRPLIKIDRNCTPVRLKHNAVDLNTLLNQIFIYQTKYIFPGLTDNIHYKLRKPSFAWKLHFLYESQPNQPS